MEATREKGSAIEMECVHFEEKGKKPDAQYNLPNECLDRFKKKH